MRIAILGAGQAATSMAARLRAKGHTGPIMVVGSEPVAPYQRPPLSKAYLLGEMGLDRLVLRGDEWWADHGIDLRLSETATSIDRDSKTVTTDKGLIQYDTLALTLGATPRRLPVAMGGHLPGVYTVRHLADVQAIASVIRPGMKMIVIGGGYIGLEGAAVARKLGLEVTLLESAPRILGRVAAPETADMIRRLHHAHGTNIREGVQIARIAGTDHANGVELADGSHLPADIIVTGIGVTPDTALAEAAGLTINNGIATDDYGTTSDPAIWAAGDCASFPWQGAQHRLESVGNAIDMAEAVADNILGAKKTYLPKPWFWSDQFDAKLQIAGLCAGYDQITTRPGDAEHGGSVWYYRNDVLIAVDALNDARAYMIGKRLIEGGKSPDPGLVATTSDLKALL